MLDLGLYGIILLLKSECIMLLLFIRLIELFYIKSLIFIKSF